MALGTETSLLLKTLLLITAAAGAIAADPDLLQDICVADLNSSNLTTNFYSSFHPLMPAANLKTLT